VPKTKFGWLKMLIKVDLISNLTFSVIGILFIRLKSKFQYWGPVRLFTGKFPNVPGAGADIRPALSFEPVILPVVALVVMSRRSGLTNSTPPGTLKIPRFFLNSSTVMPTNWAPLFADVQEAGFVPVFHAQLNVVRPELI